MDLQPYYFPAAVAAHLVAAVVWVGGMFFAYIYCKSHFVWTDFMQRDHTTIFRRSMGRYIEELKVCRIIIAGIIVTLLA